MNTNQGFGEYRTEGSNFATLKSDSTFCEEQQCRHQSWHCLGMAVPMYPEAGKDMGNNSSSMTEFKQVMHFQNHLYLHQYMLTQNMRESIQGNWNVIGWQHKTAMIQGPNIHGDLGHDRWWVDASWDESLVAGKLTADSCHWIERIFTESLKAQLSSTGPVKRLPMLDALGTGCWTVPSVDPNICCWDMFELSLHTGFTLLRLGSLHS